MQAGDPTIGIVRDAFGDFGRGQHGRMDLLLARDRGPFLPGGEFLGHRPAQRLIDQIPCYTADDVGIAAGGKWHNQMNGTVRVGRQSPSWQQKNGC